MKILIINAGSSSIKYQLIELPNNKVICHGLVERIGEEQGAVHYTSTKNKIEIAMPIPNHQVGLEKVASLLLDPKDGVIQSADEIDAVGHRVVHGGHYYMNPTIITDEVKSVIKSLYSLAPLHNPANLSGIEVAELVFPKAQQIAVFDTAFHQTIPEVVHRYAIPEQFYTENHIRLYGFHGTSHQFVSKKAMSFLGQSASKIISIHLGNGCSMTAIKDGKSMDHSLGFGPMNGLIMGTRSGDVDQSVVLFMQQHLGLSLDEVSNILQEQSGMLGLTGSNDLRDIEAASAKGDKKAQLALAMNAYRIKKYIGSYAAVMNGLDAIIFTAGIGENSSTIRKLVCTNMDFFGIVLDDEKNMIKSKEMAILQDATSKVKILVIPTNEELEIAEQVYSMLEK